MGIWRLGSAGLKYFFWRTQGATKSRGPFSRRLLRMEPLECRRVLTVSLPSIDAPDASALVAFPSVVSITTSNANPTHAASVDFAVTFDEDVTGVDASDFALLAPGLTGASIAGVTGSNASYVVSVNTGTGDGSLQLNLVDDDSIVDAGNAPLGGAGAGNGNFDGQTYTVDKTPPSVGLTNVTNPVNVANEHSVGGNGTGDAGATVLLSVTDGTNSVSGGPTTIGANGTWTISGIDVSSLSDGDLTFIATAMDAAGNVNLVSQIAPKDSQAPPVAISSATNPITIANEHSASANGTGEVGDTITLAIADGSSSVNAGPTTVLADGTWTISGIDISSLHDGTITYSATASDPAHNTAQATLQATKATVAITSISNPINILGQFDTQINGTGEIGASVSVVVSDGTTTVNAGPTTIQADGTWTITGIDVSSLNDGTLTYSVTATDAQENTAQASGMALKDTVAPTVAITSAGPVDIANQTALAISGTGEAGTAITLTVKDGTTTINGGPVTVAADGTWTISGLDVSSLVDGSLSVKATATDAAGNLGVDIKTITKDTVAPPVAISTATSPVNISNQHDATATGTGESGDTVSVLATDGTNSTTPLTTTVQGDGTWTITGIDLSGLADGPITYTAIAVDPAGNPSQAHQAATKDTVAPSVAIVSVTDPVDLANQHSASANGTGEAGDSISLAVTDGTTEIDAGKTTVAADGTWTLTGIDVSSLADGNLTFSATATDPAGNTSLHNLATPKDTVAPAVVVTNVTNPIKISNAHSVSASGTGEIGATISLSASDGTNSLTGPSTTVAADGTWTIGNFDVSSLADGTITFTATATDAANNSATAGLTASKDTVAPNIVLTTVTDPINFANRQSVVVSGTGEAGANVSLLLNDLSNSISGGSTTIAADGTWTISGIDASGLNDGSITVTATATDAVGNSAQTTLTTTKDTIAPSVAFASVSNPINLSNQHAVIVNGTGTVGASISLVASDGTHTASGQTTVNASGAWTITGLDVSALADGTITFTATATDTAGNPATTSTTASKDTVAVTVNLASVTDPINSSNQHAVTASGTGTAGANISLVASDGTHTATTQTTVNSSGAWSVSNFDVSTLSNGTITFTATASSTGGNSATSSKTATKNVSSITVAISSVTNPINSSNQHAVTASGTGTAGASISLVASDGTHTATTQTTVNSSGAWSVSNFDVSALSDGTITFTATASDTSEDTATASQTATKDTVAPAVAVTTVTNPINLNNSGAASASGTGEVGASISLVAGDGTHTIGAHTTTVGSDGTWTITGLNVGVLASGTVTFTATATDAAGNTAMSSKTAPMDLVAPTVSSIVLADPNPTLSTTVHFTVTFSEAVSGVDVSDFVAATGGGVTSATVTNVTGSGTTYTVTVTANSGAGAGTVGLNVIGNGTVLDTAGNKLSGTLPSIGPTYTINTFQSVSLAGMVYVDGNQNGVKDANEPVLPGVILTLTGTDPAGNPIPSRTTTTGGDGTYQFSGLPPGTYTIREAQPSKLLDGTSSAGSLGGNASGNVISNIVAGASATGTGYDFNEHGLASHEVSSRLLLASTPRGQQQWTNAAAGGTTAPVVVSITKADSDPAVAGSSVHFNVTFNENVTGVDGSDFSAVASSGLSGASIASVAGSGSSYTVTVNTGTGSGTLGLNLVDNDSIVDGSGNPLGGSGAGNDSFTGPAYTINAAASTAVAITGATSTVNQISQTNVSVSGTGAPGASVSVVVSDGTKTTGATTATVGSGGTWSISGINVTALSDGTITYTASQTAGGQTTQATRTATKDTVAPPVTISSVTNPINSSNANNVSANGTTEAGDTVSLTATDGTLLVGPITTTAASNGTWTISSINLSSLHDGTVSFTVKATDSAGNSSSTTMTSTKGSVTISSVTNPILILNVHSATASGTAQPNSVIQVVASDGTHSSTPQTANVASNGTWTVTGIDTSGLNDGTITFTATATSGSNTIGQSTLTTTKTTVAITTVPSSIDASNATNTSASGTGQVGANIAVTASDGTHTSNSVSGTIGADGHWSVTGINVSSLNDGTITYTVAATDSSNNTVQASKTTTKNTTGPALTLDSVTSQINIANQSSTTASGTGAVGATVSVIATDGPHATAAKTTTIGADGTWTVTGINVTGFNDGVITFAATASSSSTPNTTRKQLSANKATVVVAAATSPITANNQTNTSANGTGEVGVSVSVVATDGTHTTAAKTTTIGADGTWTVTGIDVSALSDGSITYTATATDASNNTATASFPTTKGTTTVPTAISTVTNPVNAANAIHTSVTGTAPFGSQVSVTASDGVHTSSPQVTTVPSNGHWTVNNVNVTSLSDGTITYTAVITDPANHVTSPTQTATKDTVAPTVQSIAKVDNDPTTAGSTVHFTVTFSENVTNVDLADFTLATTGVTGAQITNVAGVDGGNVYTVTVSTGSGTGTVGLNVVNNGTIIDLAGNPLAENFTGPSYTVS